MGDIRDNKSRRRGHGDQVSESCWIVSRHTGYCITTLYVGLYVRPFSFQFLVGSLLIFFVHIFYLSLVVDEGDTQIRHGSQNGHQ